MSKLAPILVDTGTLEEYPISSDERLDSHYFLQWNLKRWRGSTFRKKADPEVGWYGFQLFCIAQDGSPIGTLPCDDQQLAFDLNLPLERWQALLKRDITPLHNWRKVQCDNGEIRFAHPVVTETAKDALKSKRRNADELAKRRERKQLKDLVEKIKQIGATPLAGNPAFVERVHGWILENYPDRNRTEPIIREAMDAVSMEGN